MAYDKVDTLSDYVFWPEINSLIEFPQQEILWSPFENKASAATKNEADRKKKNRLRILMNVVTKWRVSTSRVAFVWRSKFSLQDCPKILLHLFEEDILLFLFVGKLWFKAVYQEVIFVLEVCQFFACQKSVK